MASVGPLAEYAQHAKKSRHTQEHESSAHNFLHVRVVNIDMMHVTVQHLKRVEQGHAPFQHVYIREEKQA